MGAYQSTPTTECESLDAENSRIRYGASSMQGWRRTQEDALNCCADFDQATDSMLFAVYDGHGGSEVAEYCAKWFPDFIKELNEYKENKMEEALVTAFIEFDRMLTTDIVVTKLKELAKRAESPVPQNVLRLARDQAVGDEDDLDEDEDDVDGAPVDCDEDETAGLLADACMPVEEVLDKLTNGAMATAQELSKQEHSQREKTSAEGTSTSADESKSADLNGESSAHSAVGSSAASSSTADSSEAGGSGAATVRPETTKTPGSEDSDDDSSEEDCSAELEGESDDEDSEDEDDLEEMRAGQELALKFTESEDYVELPGSDSGCTACLALIRGNKLYVANAGDSRCVLSRNGKAVDLSVDHKPEDTIEKERIAKAGGFVTPDGRVNGNLNLSRAIGDHNYKRTKSLELEEQMITPLPDIQSETITADDDFIIVACDGIWNSLTSQQCVSFVKEKLESGEKISQICEDLFHSVLADDTIDGDGTGCDNMTCVIIDLQKSTRPDPKNHRTSSTGFDHTLTEDLPASPHHEEPKAKKLKPDESE